MNPEGYTHRQVLNAILASPSASWIQKMNPESRNPKPKSQNPKPETRDLGS
jgi:hypothetical protein